MIRAASLILRRAGTAGRVEHHAEFIQKMPSMLIQPQRCMSKGGFFRSFYENLKQDLERNKEMRENLKKFKEEAAKLEQSEALQKARKKFKAIEKEASSSKVAENIQKLKEQVGETIEKSKIGEEVSRTAEAAKRTIEGIAQKGDEMLSKSDTLRAVSESMEGHRVYQAPATLLKRSDLSAQQKDIVFEANTDAQGVELHRDSKWAEGWENFKNTNPYVNKFMEMRNQLDESDNPVIRASRAVTHKIQDLFGGLFESTELSKVYTEILKMDPMFDKVQFQQTLERQIIPTVLEAMIRPELDVLKDWMYEGPYNILSAPLVQAMKAGLRLDSKVLDIAHVEIVMGKIMEQGPVLIVTFVSQQTQCVRNKSGNIVEGDPEKVMRLHHVWCFCRDPQELNPIAAWRIIDLSMSATEQLI